MKKIFSKKILLLMVVLFNTVVAFAQDKVTMLNGEKREGKIIAVRDDAIKFVYKGETLEYEFKKADISMIEFASGRKEVVNAPSAAVVSSNPAARKGKVAVLPFEFITNDGSLDATAMSHQLQTETYNSVKENTTLNQVQDPITTNSLLAKAGLNGSNLMTKTPAEMAELLGVEHVLYGIANVIIQGSSTYGSGVSSINGKSTEKKQDDTKKTKSSGTVFSSNNATVQTNYDTKIDLNFYNDQGTNEYSQSRNSFGNGFEAYRATINYLIKRCPFGTKAKR
ncbi:hypothetical protein J2X31_000576 [Flavobacterium arsenatis]|uniref:Uncharacterized protein n=1 Tax=Flavobacterium arsenatis TaxID=1484332 RepID=A0ABU1TMD4_9FLAO|nr:hypothetical protein [Flavobacterium arsenatis]MDR6966578.1 hypothetical protein [Flavobacterium arsenatis]